MKQHKSIFFLICRKKFIVEYNTYHINNYVLSSTNTQKPDLNTKFTIFKAVFQSWLLRDFSWVVPHIVKMSSTSLEMIPAIDGFGPWLKNKVPHQFSCSLISSYSR